MSNTITAGQIESFMSALRQVVDSIDAARQQWAERKLS